MFHIDDLIDIEKHALVISVTYFVLFFFEKVINYSKPLQSLFRNYCVHSTINKL